MTPSEHLWALATERANAPEHMRELFALTLDRATEEVAKELNYEIGRSASLNYGLRPYWQGSEYGFYAEALYRYIQLKLLLHRTKKRIARYEEWYGDEYLVIPRVLQCTVLKESARLSEQEDVIRKNIKAARAEKGDAIWNIEGLL